MTDADKMITIGDFERLGAFEIYSRAELLAFTEEREPDDSDKESNRISDEVSFRLGDLFALHTKLGRQLWLARRPGVISERHLFDFAHRVAKITVDRLGEEDVLSDIRVHAAIQAMEQFLKGARHSRSLDTLRTAVLDATADHETYSTSRAATGCRAVLAALDPSGYEAGVRSAYVYLELFPGRESENWIRNTLLELINRDISFGICSAR